MAPRSVTRAQQLLLGAQIVGPGIVTTADRIGAVSEDRSGARLPGRRVELRHKNEAVTASKRIAIVEDDEDVRELISMMIRNWNHTLVMSASDAESLIDAIAAGKVRPEIVLMDYRLRGMNGLEAAKRIRALDPSIRVVMVSADDGVKYEALEAGVGFLQKPFRSAQLQLVLSGT